MVKINHRIQQWQRQAKARPKSHAKPTATDSKENLDPWEAAGTADKKRSILVVWSKPENHHLTDSLLTLIEESNTYCKAFGFALLGSGKNRVTNGLCKAFIKHRDLMLQTGQGLIDADYQVKNKFPWYKQMSALYHESPAVDHSAMSNSASQLDLSVLNCSQTMDDDKSSTVFTPLLSPSNKPMTPAPCVKSEPSFVHRTSGQKQKSMHSHIEDLTTSLGELRVKVARVWEQEHTLRIQAKQDQKQAEFDSCLQFKAAKAERQYAHELVMLERQIELEHLRA
ncbi:uncharacterized protein EDB93DRAFT_1106096 [Suillus bovinus]|uniref:uncharacterized protein n=1 Tax=Suillus bovinus TaxID=48563 RepID=UPI001B870EAA|nr:uncharacterized protein EDB93DRAFT_1106096 [Suillus bovinus]KAG2139612.1 hypothetical protein EDB93DRAFT_1106096 [Suillus bovinus]